MDNVKDKKASEAARTLSKLGASKGGKARAAALSAEERRAIAREAITARWARREGDLPIAEYEGKFPLGSAEISCAVLPDGKRIITQAAFLTALGRSPRPEAGTGVLSTVDEMPSFLRARALQPFISKQLIESSTPIFYRTKAGERRVGYDAVLLPRVAEVYLRFRDQMLKDQGSVQKRYEHIILAADVLVRGLANVGIIALVDEATGYQEVRDRNELHKILAAYISEELLPWAQRFPPGFYKEIFRLKGWIYSPLNPMIGLGLLLLQIVLDTSPSAEGTRSWMSSCPFREWCVHFEALNPWAFSEDTLARVQLLKNLFPYACPRHWISPSIFRVPVYEISRLNSRLPVCSLQPQCGGAYFYGRKTA